MKKPFSVRVVLVAGIFAAGFFCGSLSQRPAQAQLGDLGGKAMEAAGNSGSGPLAAAGKLGTSISDMQTHLDALNKTLEMLKQIKGMLGG